MIVRVVCEGSTDFAILGVVVRAVLRDSQPVITAIQPNFDALRARVPGTPGSGWQGVRSYLQSPSLAVVAERSDVLVVQVDADIRRVAEIEKMLREPGPEEAELDPLCEQVKSWFAGGVPASAVVVLPREAMEAWLLAVHTRLSDVEAEPAPASTLMVKGLLGETKRGEPNKQAAVYEELSRSLADLIADKKHLARVPELARFVTKLRARAFVLRRPKKAVPPA